MRKKEKSMEERCQELEELQQNTIKEVTKQNNRAF